MARLHVHCEGASKTAAPSKRLTYEARGALAQNSMARRCFDIMVKKRTNLSVAVDVPTADEMLRLADLVGPHVCVLKTHVDIFDKWDSSVVARLEALAEEHNFLIFEDRKFADIGNTVMSQYGGGIYKIANWSHITNAHLVPGPGIIDGLRVVGGPKGRGLLLLAEMSSQGTLAQGAYTEAVAKAAEANLVRTALSSHSDWRSTMLLLLGGHVRLQTHGRQDQFANDANDISTLLYGSIQKQTNQCDRSGFCDGLHLGESSLVVWWQRLSWPPAYDAWRAAEQRRRCSGAAVQYARVSHRGEEQRHYHCGSRHHQG
jgi:orotidine 5'-phosphate decarboxylase subfamily 1